MTVSFRAKTVAEQLLTDLRREVASGKPWFIALLQAIARWSLPEETVSERHYCYLVAGEAFDWLLLAERLCEAVSDLIPQEEYEPLLFFGQLPLDLSEEELRRLMGHTKYRAHLNYFYGVILEEMLQLVIEEDIHKEQRSRVWENHRSVDEEAFRRLYGRPQTDLLCQFRQEQGVAQTTTLSLTEAKEFTYWLFKYRLRYTDPARVACDTRRALGMLRRLEHCRARCLSNTLQEPPNIIEIP
ncbi:MAG: hypothetical protein ACUVV3_07310 [Dehalococcoidia bacterium]